MTGNIVAPFWHPVRLASEAALADVLTNGRIELGIARGAYQFEFDRLMDGMNAMQGGSHLREMVPLLQQLWAGDVAHEGENWSFPAATSVPKPMQAGGPRDLDRGPRPGLARLRGRERLRRLLHAAREGRQPRSRTWSRSSRRRARRIPRCRARA